MDQFRGVATRLLNLLLGSSSPKGCAHNGSLRLISEMHYTRYSTEAQLSRLGPSSPLAHVATTCGCKLVLATRLREPLSFYVSFYQWTVAWRQARKTTS